MPVAEEATIVPLPETWVAARVVWKLLDFAENVGIITLYYRWLQLSTYQYSIYMHETIKPVWLPLRFMIMESPAAIAEGIMANPIVGPAGLDAVPIWNLFPLILCPLGRW